MRKAIASTWYERQRLADDVTLIHETHVAPWLRCNIWHVRGRDRDLLIDTGMGLRPLKQELPQITERPVIAVVTHTHFDHSAGLDEFDCRAGHRAEAAVMENPSPAATVADGGFVRAESFSAWPYEGFSPETFTVRPAPLTQYLDEGDRLDLGDRSFQVLHLPGHSPGSIALYEDKTLTLFSGDTIYDGPLLDDLYHSDPAVYDESLRRLRELPVNTIHGGHGDSFGRDKMLEIIDEFLAGGRRMGDPEAWIAAQIALG